MTLCRWKWTQTLHLSTNLQICCGCHPLSDITPNLCCSCRHSPSPLLPPPPLPSLCCCRPSPSPFKPTINISRMSKSPTKSLMKWEKSNGKKMLKTKLWDVNSRFHSINIKDIHSSDARYPLKNFTTNYKISRWMLMDWERRLTSTTWPSHSTRSPILAHPTQNKDILIGTIIQQNNILKMMFTMGLQTQWFQVNWGWPTGWTKTFHQTFSA